MGAALRAYLMIRGGTGAWTTSIHRDLDDLVATWAARERHPAAIGLVHVGFAPVDPRPIAVACAGAEAGVDVVDAPVVWLTAGAKHTLPEPFDTSAVPIAVTDGLAIYAATAGWDDAEAHPAWLGDRDVAALVAALGGPPPDGPAAADDAAPAMPPRHNGATAPASIAPDVAPDPWIAAYLDRHPGRRAAFAARGIATDAQYREREAALPDDARTEAGQCRARALAGERWYDVTAIARAAPPWLTTYEIISTDLPARALNAIHHLGVMTVGDLGGVSWDRLRNARNIGPHALNDLVVFLEQMLADGPSRVVVPVPVAIKPAESALPMTLLDAVDESLAAVAERDRRAVAMRMGREGSPRTLQEISDVFGISRERVRQIESKVIRRWLIETRWPEALEEHLEWMLQDRDRPLRLADLPVIDPWFAGIDAAPTVLAYVLRVVTGRRFSLLEIEGDAVVTTLPEDSWTAAVSDARAVLGSDGATGQTEAECVRRVAACLPDTARDLAGPLWRVAARQAQFGVDTSGRRVLRGFGRGAEPVVAAVLAEAETPLHYTVLAQRASIRAGRMIEERRVHAIATDIGLLLGRGTFGTDRHLPLSDAELRRLAEAATDVVLDDPSDRQWHTWELLTRMAERSDPPVSNVTPYLLEIALQRFGGLEKMGRFLWTARGNDAGSSERINVRDTLIALLEEAGHPLTSAELRERLTERRGVGRIFQIPLVAPLIRVQPGVWGLIDRDLPITEEDRATLVSNIVAALERDGVGIHLSEVPDRVAVPAGLSLEAVASLAILDPRLRVNRSEYLSCAEWDGPRRLSVTEAVAAVLDDSPDPLSFDEIVDRGQAALGWACERVAISAALQHLGAERLPDGTWMGRADSSDAARPSGPDDPDVLMMTSPIF